MEMVKIEDASTPSDLVVSIVERIGGSTAVSFAMQKALYRDKDCNRLMHFYIHVLDELSKNPSMLVQDRSLFSSSTIGDTSAISCGCYVEFKDWDSTLLHRFDAMVQKCPGKVAVKLGLSEEKMTYGQLDDQSRLISQGLINFGVSLNSRVAVLCDPGIRAVASMLAILCIAAIYVPPDPCNPQKRLAAIISDSSPSAILWALMGQWHRNFLPTPPLSHLSTENAQHPFQMLSTPVLPRPKTPVDISWS